MPKRTPRDIRTIGLLGSWLGLCVSASCASRSPVDEPVVNTGLARFELESLDGFDDEGMNEMPATNPRSEGLALRDPSAPPKAKLSAEELRMLHQSTKDLEAAFSSGDQMMGVGEAVADVSMTAPPPSQLQAKPVEASNQPKMPAGMVPGWLRAFSTAVVGPLTATGHERRRANRIADGAALMATQMLMPAITEDDVITLEEQIADVAEELAALLRDQASGSEDPGRVYLTMAALEAIRPGVLSELAEEDAGELGVILSPPEVEAIRAARAIVSGFADDEDANDPNALADLLENVATGLRPHTDIKITEAQLCRRVVGFGQYTALPSSTFVAGRSSRVIVYTELDRFAHRPVTSRDRAGEGEQWAVEVAQSATLFVSRGDRQPVWHEPEQRVLQTSRRQIHDLYLVQMITLPPNLGVGSYELRVRVRDLAGNSVDERVIPIRLVADAGLIKRAS